MRISSTLLLSSATPTKPLPVAAVRRRILLPTRRPARISPGLWQTVSRLNIVIVGQPRVVDPSEGRQRDMPKAAYYAVQSGRQPGIYDTWAECEAQTKGYTGAKFKKFPTRSAAETFIGQPPTSTSTSTNSFSTTSSRPVPGKSDDPPAAATTAEASSPSASIAPSSSLPESLRTLAEAGYLFTPTAPHHLIAYTDGSSRHNGTAKARAGAGVWWGRMGEAAGRNLSERVGGMPQTNNRGELLSVILALENCPFPDLPLEIRTDSQYTIMCMTTWLPTWLRSNFLTSSSSSSSFSRFGKQTSRGGARGNGNAKTEKVKNADMIKHLLILLRRRRPGQGVRFRYVAGHSGIEGNEGADLLARLGAEMPAKPDREKWLDPDDEEQGELLSGGKTDIEVEVDESWLMSPEELGRFERDFVEDDED